MNGGSGFSAAADRSKEPILARLRPLLKDSRQVLEVGSGTGQHARHFAAGMPWLRWLASELPARLPGLREGLGQHGIPNLDEPLALDVLSTWPKLEVDVIYTANTLHIMPWSGTVALMKAAGRTLPRAGRLLVYGPFHYGGKATSDSNAAFDRALTANDPERGIRNIEAVKDLAARESFCLLADFAMPANNRLLAWEKIT